MPRTIWDCVHNSIAFDFEAIARIGNHPYRYESQQQILQIVHEYLSCCWLKKKSYAIKYAWLEEDTETVRLISCTLNYRSAKPTVESKWKSTDYRIFPSFGARLRCSCDGVYTIASQRLIHDGNPLRMYRSILERTI